MRGRYLHINPLPAYVGMARPENKRVNLSCLPCRSRKIKCDRNIPNCSSCVRRGIAHKCRWGDERDDLVQKQASPPKDVLLKNVVDEVMHKLQKKDSEEPETVDTVASATYFACQTPLDRAGAPAWEHRMRSLPTEEACKSHVQFFLQHINPIINVVNANQLLAHLTEFYRQDSRSATSEFWEERPNWGLASLLFAILQLVDDHMEMQDRIGTKWHDAAMYFLLNSNHMCKPTLRTLQTMAILRERLLYKAPFRAVIMWHSVTIRLAQSMSLHQLGSVGQDVQYLRTRLPWSEANELPQPNSLVSVCENLRFGYLWGRHFSKGDLSEREIGRKVWHNLLAFDWLAANHANHTYVISETSTSTSPPGHLGDKEVLQLDAWDPNLSMDFFSSERPTEVGFVSALTKHAACTRKQVDLENESRVVHGVSRLDPSTIMTLDTEYRFLLAQLPRYYRLDGVSEHEWQNQQDHLERPWLTVQRLVLHQEVHYQIMITHSPYLIEGLRQPALQKHAAESVRSANTIVALYKEIHALNSPVQQKFNLLIQLLFAALVLHFSCAMGDNIAGAQDMRNNICFVVEHIHSIFEQRDILHSNEFTGLLRALRTVYVVPGHAAGTDNETELGSNADGEHVSKILEDVTLNHEFDFGTFVRLMSSVMPAD